MSVLENVVAPWTCTAIRLPAARDELARFKLALVGLAGDENRYPASLSGGMRKRAALARALALDPAVLFLDEPSAGLDPLASRRLDELVLALRDGLGITVVLVTHELESLYGIADRMIFLDGEAHRPVALGSPAELARSAESREGAEFPGAARGALERDETAQRDAHRRVCAGRARPHRRGRSCSSAAEAVQAAARGGELLPRFRRGIARRRARHVSRRANRRSEGDRHPASTRTRPRSMIQVDMELCPKP